MEQYYFNPTDLAFYPHSVYGARELITIDENDTEVVVPNEQCSLPPEAVPVEYSVYEAVIAAREAGKQISADEQGHPVISEAPPPPLAEEILRHQKAIDNAAGHARASFVSPGSYIDQEYILAKQEAADWLAGGQDGAAIPSSVQDHITMFEVSAERAAREIVATAEQWETALRDIRQLRLGGKAAVQRAGTIEAAEAAAQKAIDQLNRYRPPKE